MEFTDGTILCDLCSRLIRRHNLLSDELAVDCPSPYSPCPDYVVKRHVCLYCRQAIYNQHWLYFPQSK